MQNSNHLVDQLELLNAFGWTVRIKFSSECQHIQVDL